MGFALSYQLAAKEAKVREALESAGVAAPGKLGWVLGPRLGYRNRVRLRIDEGGGAGFFNEHKSVNCAVLEPALHEGLRTVQTVCTQHPELTRPLRHVELRTRDLDGRFALSIARPPGTTDTTAEGLRRRLGSEWIVSPPDLESFQRHPLTRTVEYFVPPNAFMQINTAVAQRLVEHVCAGARERSLCTFIDLYCGAGNFAVALGLSGLTGEAVDCNSRAVAAGRQTIQLHRLDGISVHAADALPWLRENATQKRPDLVVLDPPRAGLKEGAPLVAAVAGKAIVYCSCNPKSFAADVRQLSSAGFSLETLTLFDMFPHTDHVELAGWLRRG